MENTYADMSDKGLISKIYKEIIKKLTQHTPKKSNQKVGKGPEQALYQRGHTEGQ